MFRLRAKCGKFDDEISIRIRCPARKIVPVLPRLSWYSGLCAGSSPLQASAPPSVPRSPRLAGGRYPHRYGTAVGTGAVGRARGVRGKRAVPRALRSSQFSDRPVGRLRKHTRAPLLWSRCCRVHPLRSCQLEGPISCAFRLLRQPQRLLVRRPRPHWDLHSQRERRRLHIRRRVRSE